MSLKSGLLTVTTLDMGDDELLDTLISDRRTTVLYKIEHSLLSRTFYEDFSNLRGGGGISREGNGIEHHEDSFS